MRSATTGAQAVDRAASLLVHVLGAGEAVAFPDLVASTGLPKSTVSRLLASLERNRLVARTPGGEVVPGDVVMAFARRHSPHDELVERARPVLERLGAATGETVNLAIPSEGGVVQIDQVDSRYLLGAVNWLDRQVPYHATASGKAMLAHGLPIPSGRLPRLTERTRTTRTTLEADLRRCVELGYAVADGELEPGLVAVAAAVLGPDGRAVGAVSVSGPSSRLTPRLAAQVGALLAQECAALSAPPKPRAPHHGPSTSPAGPTHATPRRPTPRKAGAA
jgi:IclR family acetate operon transcriptional repressor